MAANLAETAIKQGIKTYLRVSRLFASPTRSIGGAWSRLVAEARSELGGGTSEPIALPPAGGSTVSTGATGEDASAATGRAVTMASTPRPAGHQPGGTPERADQSPSHVSSPQVDHEAVGGGAARSSSESPGSPGGSAQGQSPGGAAKGGTAGSGGTAGTGASGTTARTSSSKAGPTSSSPGSSGSGTRRSGGSGQGSGGGQPRSDTSSASSARRQPSGGTQGNQDGSPSMPVDPAPDV